MIHSKYQKILSKELSKILETDIIYIDKERQPEFKTFSKKFSDKYVKHFTKLKNKKCNTYTVG